MKKSFFFLTQIVRLFIFIFCWIFLTSFEGISYRHIQTDKPHSIHIIEVDPDRYEIIPVRARDMGVGRESVLSMANRYNAKAAINAGFFAIGGTYDGIPRGILKIDNHWYGLGIPGKPRGAVGWKKGGKEFIFDRLLASVTCKIGTSPISIEGLNQPRGENAITLFSSDFSFTTLTNPQGYELLIENQQVSTIRGGGSSRIPHEGWVISVSEKKTSTFPQDFFQEGTLTFIQFDALPQEHTLNAKERWNHMDHIVAGTPLLIHHGKRITDFSSEKTIESFLKLPHARTALGILPNGHWIFVAIDGKQPTLSIGMTMNELAEFMEGLGCEYALNLDGGGSTTMIFDQAIVNQPVGDEDEDNQRKKVRLVSDAILIRPRNAR